MSQKTSKEYTIDKASIIYVAEDAIGLNKGGANYLTSRKTLPVISAALILIPIGLFILLMPTNNIRYFALTVSASALLSLLAVIEIKRVLRKNARVQIKPLIPEFDFSSFTHNICLAIAVDNALENKINTKDFSKYVRGYFLKTLDEKTKESEELQRKHNEIMDYAKSRRG